MLRVQSAARLPASCIGWVTRHQVRVKRVPGMRPFLSDSHTRQRMLKLHCVKAVVYTHQ